MGPRGRRYGCWRTIDGHHRVEASVLCGFDEVPALVETLVSSSLPRTGKTGTNLADSHDATGVEFELQPLARLLAIQRPAADISAAGGMVRAADFGRDCLPAHPRCRVARRPALAGDRW